MAIPAVVSVNRQVFSNIQLKLMKKYDYRINLFAIFVPFNKCIIYIKLLRK